MTQPMPKPGKQSVLDAVVEDLRRREETLGVKKYGRRLETHNGRDALTDAYEEALDMAQYLKQALMERDGSTAAEALGVAAFRLHSYRQRCKCWGKMSGSCPTCAETLAIEELCAAAYPVKP